MNDNDREPVARLSAEQQAEYQQTYNDPAKRGSTEWLQAGQALMAAGVIAPSEMVDPAIEAAYGTAEPPKDSGS